MKIWKLPQFLLIFYQDSIPNPQNSNEILRDQIGCVKSSLPQNMWKKLQALQAAFAIILQSGAPQIWVISPDLGKWQISKLGKFPRSGEMANFLSLFVMEESIVTSYNYSETCITYWRIKNFIFVPRHATRKKVIKINLFFVVQFSPDLGKLPRFQENFKHFWFFPKSGEIP